MHYLSPEAQAEFTYDLAAMQTYMADLRAQNPTDPNTVLPQHRSLAGHIETVRAKMMPDYQSNVPLLADHIADAGFGDTSATLVVHASNGLTVRDLNEMSRDDPDLLEARVKGLRGFLRTVVSVEPGQPFSHELSSDNGDISHTLSGTTQAVPIRLATTRLHELAVTTPFIAETPRGRLCEDGIVALNNLALRGHVLYSRKITIGTDTVKANFAGAIARARQSGQGVYELRDMLQSAHSQQLPEFLSAEDLALVDEQVCKTYATEQLYSLDLPLCAQVMRKISGPNTRTLETRIADTKELVIGAVAEETADAQSVQAFSFACEQAARKIILLDRIATIQTDSEIQEAYRDVLNNNDGLVAAFKNVVAQVAAYDNTAR